MNKRLDISHILKKITEIDKIKEIIFDKNQIILY